MYFLFVPKHDSWTAGLWDFRAMPNGVLKKWGIELGIRGGVIGEMGL